MEMVETWRNACYSSCLTIRNHIPAIFPSDCWYGLHILPKTFILGATQAKTSRFHILNSVEMVETGWSTCHSSYLTLRNHIPVIFPPIFWCGLHIPSQTSFLGQKGATQAKKSQFYALKRMEMVETLRNTCHSSCLTMGNHIPAIFPSDFWYGLHISPKPWF